MPDNSKPASDCLFCSIARGAISAHFVSESASVVAFLDINPIRPGHLQIVPREHFPYYDDVPPAVALEVLRIGQTLAPVLRSMFQVQRVAFLFTGGDIAHAHAHVVPMVESTDITSRRYIAEEHVTFRSTPRATDRELADISLRIHRALQAQTRA